MTALFNKMSLAEKQIKDDLHSACSAGNLPEVERLLAAAAAGFLVIAFEFFDCTQLVYAAAERGHIDIVRLLLDSGAGAEDSNDAQ